MGTPKAVSRASTHFIAILLKKHHQQRTHATNSNSFFFVCRGRHTKTSREGRRRISFLLLKSKSRFLFTPVVSRCFFRWRSTERVERRRRRKERLCAFIPGTITVFADKTNGAGGNGGGGGGMTAAARALAGANERDALPPSTKRLKCELDLEDASDNIINYKKLVKEQTGISVKEQMKKKKEKEEKMGDAQN